MSEERAPHSGHVTVAQIAVFVIGSPTTAGDAPNFFDEEREDRDQDRQAEHVDKNDALNRIQRFRQPVYSAVAFGHRVVMSAKRLRSTP